MYTLWVIFNVCCCKKSRRFPALDMMSWCRFGSLSSLFFKFLNTAERMTKLMQHELKTLHSNAYMYYKRKHSILLLFLFSKLFLWINFPVQFNSGNMLFLNVLSHLCNWFITCTNIVKSLSIPFQCALHKSEALRINLIHVSYAFVLSNTFFLRVLFIKNKEFMSREMFCV